MSFVVNAQVLASSEDRAKREIAKYPPTSLIETADTGLHKLMLLGSSISCYQDQYQLQVSLIFNRLQSKHLKGHSVSVMFLNQTEDFAVFLFLDTFHIE